MPKLKPDFKPIRIIDIEAIEILFNMILNRPFSRDIYKRYQGTAPMSLDMLRVIEESTKLEDRIGPENCKGLIPFYPYKQSTLKATEAVINVSFSRPELRKINRLDVPSPSSVEIDDKDLRDKYKEFAIAFYTNKKLANYRYTIDDPAFEAEIDQHIQSEELLQLEQMNRFRSKTMRQVTSFFTELLALFLFGVPDADKSSSFLKAVRKYIYNKGFKVAYQGTVRHYQLYKRSASKAKKGNVIFIYEALYQPMMDYTWLGLKLEKNALYDLTSVKAYEALVMSSIIGQVRISNPSESILMLDSVKAKDPVNGNIKILTRKNRKLTLMDREEFENKTKKKTKFEHRNILWDGQALVDESIFKAAGYDKKNPHAMMLLRNSFFKACAFNTNIKKYYRDQKVKTVTDMFGRTLQADKIKMIVTIDSLKLDKFVESFKDDPILKDASDKRKALYEHWLERIDDNFGIVKEEHASYLGHGKYHTISYQILNTLPLKEDELKKILTDEIDYVKKLRDDPSVMYDHLKNTTQAERKKYFIANMLRYAPGFEELDYYKKFKTAEINAYKRKHLCIGEIKIRGDFYVLCSMPMEMLEYSVHRDVNKIHPYLKPDTAYIQGTIPGDDIVLCRYPHMNSGSVCTYRQALQPIYDDNKTTNKYFNLKNGDGSNIVIVSPWNSNVQVKLGGADFDSDTAFFIQDKTIQAAAKRLNELTFLNPGPDGLPVALADDKALKKEGPNNSPYNEDALAKLDAGLARSSITIGQISNNAQLFNSYFWHEYMKNEYGKNVNKQSDSEPNTDYLKKVYDCILKLSMLNELEIDKAKHKINISLENEMNKILIETYPDKDSSTDVKPPHIIKTNGVDPYVPYFMALLSDGKKPVIPEKYWNTPVDQIEPLLKRLLSPAKRSTEKDTNTNENPIDLEMFFQPPEGRNPNTRLMGQLRMGLRELLPDLTELDKDMDMDETEKKDAKDLCLENFLSTVSSKSFTPEVMKELFHYAFAKYKKDIEFTDPETGEESVIHKKGDYRYPELANNSVKYKYLGILFLIGEYMAEKKQIPDPAIACIKDKQDKKLPLLKYKSSGDPNSPGENEIVLWGDVYEKTLEENEP